MGFLEAGEEEVVHDNRGSTGTGNTDGTAVGVPKEREPQPVPQNGLLGGTTSTGKSGAGTVARI